MALEKSSEVSASAQDQFEAACIQAKAFTKLPSHEELLALYALYKQSTIGDCNVPAPTSFYDIKAQKKHDFWEKLKGTSKAKAMRSYVAFVKKLAERYT